MRIITNEQLAKRNKQMAQYAFFASFLVPLGGLLLINQQTGTPTQLSILVGAVLPILVLPLAYGVMIFAIRLSNLWVRDPRPDLAIAAGIKGLPNQSVLYNYMFFPARHVIFAPQGVFAIVTRFQDGTYTTQGRSWTTNKNAISRILSMIRMDNIGNPTADAEKAAAHIADMLKPVVGEITVQPLIVFVDARVRLTVTDPEVPVVHADPKSPLNIKDYLRDVAKQNLPTLTPQQIKEFEDLYVATV